MIKIHEIQDNYIKSFAIYVLLKRQSTFLSFTFEFEILAMCEAFMTLTAYVSSLRRAWFLYILKYRIFQNFYSFQMMEILSMTYE